MSIRSAAAAALWAALPAAATAQLPPIPDVPPAPVVAPADPPARLPAALPDPAPPAIPPAVLAGPTVRAADPADVWARFEWLYWVGSRQPLPPLVTTSPLGTPPAVAGVPGLPTTLTAFGGRANTDFRSGFRAALGTWVNDARTFGVEADFFFLGRSADGYAASSTTPAVIARPVVSAATGLPAAVPVSFPGIAGGTVEARSTSSAIGGGLFGVANLRRDPCGDRLDFLFGFRYFHVGDLVTVNSSTTTFGNAFPVPPGTTVTLTDRFGTSNDFYGHLLGLSGEKRVGPLFVGGRVSVALGGVVEAAHVDGSAASGPAAAPVGLLAGPGVVGTHRHESFAVMPEVGVRGGCWVTEHARVYAGYDFLYLSRVARAGDQINLAGAGGFPNQQTDYWLQGVNLGVEVRY